MLLARAPAHRLDLILDVGEFARNQDFVVGSEIGAPENIEVRFGQTRKRLRAVEQYDHAAEFARETARELASGSQQHAFADLIEGDAMFRRQHLHAADPGDHLDVQREPLGAHALDDPQRAVVDRRIAPHQNASDFVFLKFVLEPATISQASEARAAVRWPSRPARSRNRRNPWSIGTGPQPISSPTTMTGCGAARKPSSWRSHAATRLASSRSRRSASHSPMLSITAPEGAGRRSASACTMSAGASSVRHAAGRSARWRRTRSTISSSRASVL